jgi:hypothetical protein
MAKLALFRIDGRAVREGEWVSVEEYGDLEILTRGFGDEYTDAQARRQRQAAKAFGGDTDKLPVKIRRQINIECLIAHVVRDVRNLEHDDGTPVAFPEFCDLLRDPDYPGLLLASFQAAAQVGARREIDIEEAVPPLAPSSGTGSSGGDTAH